MTGELHDKRREYEVESVDELGLSGDPFEQFERWYQAAEEKQVVEPNAMVLATVDANGQASQRTVLLKYFDRQGFVFLRTTPVAR